MRSKINVCAAICHGTMRAADAVLINPRLCKLPTLGRTGTSFTTFGLALLFAPPNLPSLLTFSHHHPSPSPRLHDYRWLANRADTGRSDWQIQMGGGIVREKDMVRSCCMKEVDFPNKNAEEALIPDKFSERQRDRTALVRESGHTDKSYWTTEAINCLTNLSHTAPHPQLVI